MIDQLSCQSTSSAVLGEVRMHACLIVSPAVQSAWPGLCNTGQHLSPRGGWVGVQIGDETWTALGGPAVWTSSVLSGIGSKGGEAEGRTQETSQKVLKWEW